MPSPLISKIISLSFLARRSSDYNRSSLLDALRGLGILLMVVFHFFYDLTLFNLAKIPIYSSAEWIAFRYVILTLFLGSAGMSLFLHYRRGIHWHSYGRRLFFLIICAALITLTTYLTLGDQFIYFGILHLIAVASVLGLLFVRLTWLSLPLGICILFFGFTYENSIFNNFSLRWIGMLTIPTGSADFTPIFPWFGMVLLGIFIARSLGDRIYTGGSALLAPLARMGRHSLLIYMLHQPILWGLIFIFVLLFGG